MSNRARVVNALAYSLLGAAALFLGTPWLALLSTLAAAETAPDKSRLPLRVLALILACLTWWRVPFTEGQALLSDFVLPCLLVAMAAMSPRRLAPRHWHLGIVTAALVFLLGGVARDQPLSAEIAAAVCVMMGGLGA